MKTDVQIIDGYHGDVIAVVDELKSMVAPVTTIGKEYVAIITGQQVCIFSVTVGAQYPSLTDSIFSKIDDTLFIGIVSINNIAEDVVQLICKYWETMRMRADKEVAVMYSSPESQKIVNL